MTQSNGTQNTGAFEALLQEDRTYPPPPEFSANANISDPVVYEEANRDPEAFWARFAGELDWFEPWDTVLDWSGAPFAKWFVGGKLNAAYNCIDRHLKGPRKNKAAIIWEGEPGDWQVYTYQDLYREVCKFANGLKSLGVEKGDRVTLYMPMVPELAIAMLACARIGAPHSIVFGGFSAESLRDRIEDSQSKVMITADGGWRRGGIIQLKQNADASIEGDTPVEKVVVVKRTGHDVPIVEGRDVWWHDLVADQPLTCEPEVMDSEDMLFMLYTSGTTGKPKGIVHTTGGYMTGTYATSKWIFDLKEDDIYWCTADIGWVTGHSYIIYGPLANGATTVMYEGSPDYPDRDRFWAIVEKYACTICYTAPTAIRTFMRWGEEYPNRHDMSSLRLLGSVGEPINPEAWVWYWQHIGGGRCPVVDTWWQTETGSVLISPLPGITTLKPGSATQPFPGIDAAILDEQGNEIGPGGGGYLVIRKPWPSMLRGIYGDPERFVQQYWSNYEGIYFTSDGAKLDEESYFWLLGRVDDVINVSAHRISTMEVESALVDNLKVAEAACIGRTHDVKGQAIVAFVTLKDQVAGSDDVISELKQHVAGKIGPMARPDDIYFAAELPKTRSGKIMRRLLRDVAEGRALGDTTTLADPAVVEMLKEQYGDEE